MAKHEPSQATSGGARRSAVGGVGSRIDPPHALRTLRAAEASSAAPIETTAEARNTAEAQSTAEAREVEGEIEARIVPVPAEVAGARQWLAKQAREISGHLKRRQADLDRREAQLHKQLAELENDNRTARLWWQERQEELATREQQLDERDRELAQSQSNVAAAEAYQESARRETERDAGDREQKLNELHAKLETWAGQLMQREAATRAAQQELAAERDAIHQASRRERQQIDCRRVASVELARLLLRGLSQRREALADDERRAAEHARHAEALAAQRQAEVDLVSRQVETRRQAVEAAEALLEQGRQELKQQSARQRTKRAKPVTPADAPAAAAVSPGEVEQLAAKRRYLVELEQELNGRRDALEQLRTELAGVHRQSLEMRLAAEELCAKLSGAATPARLSQSLADVRRQIADQYRLHEADLEERRQQLSSLEQRLADQSDRLERRQAELRQWVARRQEELDEQARDVVLRTEDLAREQYRSQSVADEWQVERAGYQEEIRRLMSKLRQREAALV